MSRYFSPFESISPIDTRVFPVSAATTTIGQTGSPQTDTDAGSAAPQASASSSSPTVDQARVQKYLDSALKNTGFKAEIANMRNGYTVVRLIESDSGHVILQMPSQTVLEIVASLEQQQQDTQKGEPSAPAVGAVLDQFA